MSETTLVCEYMRNLNTSSNCKRQNIVHAYITFHSQNVYRHDNKKLRKFVVISTQQFSTSTNSTPSIFFFTLNRHLVFKKSVNLLQYFDAF